MFFLAWVVVDVEAVLEVKKNTGPLCYLCPPIWSWFRSAFFFFHTSNWRSGCTKRPVVSNSFRFGVLLELCYVIFVLADQTVNRLYITSGWPTQIARLDLYNKIIFLCICIFAFLIVSFSVQFRYIAFGIVQWFLLNIFFVIFFTSQTYIVFLLVFVDIDLLNEKTGCSECLDWFE